MSVPHGPLPDVDDPRFAPFWAGTREGRLRIPRCDACARRVWPPRDTCPRCAGEAFTWTEVAQEGVLYSWTVVHAPTVDMPAPYVVGVVTLDGADGVRLLGNVDCPLEALAIDLRLRARFDAASSTCTLVNWVPVDVSSSG